MHLRKYFKNLEQALPSFFRDKSGHVVITQFPNISLWVWGIFMLLSRFVQGDLQAALGFVARAALVFWAAQEIFTGSSPFRKVLGVIVFIFTIGGAVYQYLN